MTTPTTTPLIGHAMMTETNELTAILQAHTCPIDGYIYAWQDSTNPLLVWTLSGCPVDAVLPGVRLLITSSVTDRYRFTDQIVDPRQRILAVITGCLQDATDYLAQHTNADIAAFLSDRSKLHAQILSELVAQGIVQ